MRAPASLIALLVTGCFLLGIGGMPARGDLVISGFHGVRVYDERTGAFLKDVQRGEEQEGIAFGKDGRLYVLINDMGGGWMAQYAPGSYKAEYSFGPRSFTGIPMALTIGPDGNFYAGGASVFGMKGGIRRINGRSGEDLGVFVAEGEGGLGLAMVLVFGPDGHLYVSNWGGSKVMRFNGGSGEFMDDFIPAGSGGLEGAAGVAFGPDGNVYVSSEVTDQVLRFDGRSGDFLGVFVSAGLGGLDGPASLVFGPDGNLYVCSRVNHSVMRYDGKTGSFMDVFVPAGSGGLDNGPNYIAFTPRAPKLRIAQTAEGMMVSWENAGSNCVLEAADTAEGGWQALTNAGTGECMHVITRESSGGGAAMFFRLRQVE
jgi:DNA-binding beta-propeller fold protein YncE